MLNVETHAAGRVSLGQRPGHPPCLHFSISLHLETSWVHGCPVSWARLAKRLPSRPGASPGTPQGWAPPGRSWPHMAAQGAQKYKSESLQAFFRPGLELGSLPRGYSGISWPSGRASQECWGLWVLLPVTSPCRTQASVPCSWRLTEPWASPHPLAQLPFPHPSSPACGASVSPWSEGASVSGA